MASSIWDLHLTEEKNIDAETLSSFMFAVAGTISTLRHGVIVPATAPLSIPHLGSVMVDTGKPFKRYDFLGLL